VGDLQFQAATRDYREQFYEFSLEGTGAVRLNDEITGSITLGWKNVRPTADLPAYSRFSAQFSIERKILDDRIIPMNGLSLRWSVSYVYRSYALESLAAAPERSSFNETRTVVAIDWYRKLKGVLGEHFGLNYVGLETSESLPPISELFFLGGPGTLRGFRTEQFTAIRAAYGTAEPQLHFTGGVLFAFYDAAYLSNRMADFEGGIRTHGTYRHGYGVGLAFFDAHRAVKLSMGWNPEVTFDQPRLTVELTSDL
jgi:hemolysin activation/secretion protein